MNDPLLPAVLPDAKVSPATVEAREVKARTDSLSILMLLGMLRSQIQDAPNKADLDEQTQKIMSAIKDYNDAVSVALGEIENNHTAMNEHVVGLVDDVAFLKETLARIESSPAPISAEDQAALDAGRARLVAMSARATAIKNALAAADAATTRIPAPPLPQVDPPAPETI